MNIHWYVDVCIVKKHEQEFAALKKALSKYPHTLTEYIPFSTEQEELADKVDDTCINLLYGTHGFIRNMRSMFGQSVTAYCPEEVMQTSYYYSKLRREWLLNGHCVWMPWSMCSSYSSFLNLCSMLDSKHLFIRPNSGFKTFAGQVFSPDNMVREMDAVEQLSSVTDETLCLISPAKRIDSETRFIVVDGKIVDYSYYRINGKLNIQHGAPEEAKELAEKMATYHWQPTLCYTCDVAMTFAGPRIVELNSFSCAGLYACDYEKVFDAVTSATIKQYDDK